jgi:heme-degrading monooxygenase HmoA
MFSVLFEVHPKSDQWDAYLGYAKMLRPELEQVEGFVDNIRYKSLNREGWILSLSNWRNEKAVVRWRTKMRHHEVQELGRGEVLSDYHLRVGQITSDTKLPEGFELKEQRLDETEVGEGTSVVLIDAKRPAEWKETANTADCGEWLGLEPLHGFLDWDLFEAVLTPGDIILLITFKDRPAGEAFMGSASLPQEARMRSVRVIRDYGMFDRREAPQYYPEVQRPNKIGGH